MTRSIWRGVALVIAAALALGAVAAIAAGAWPAAVPMLVWAVLMAVGVAFERWRYKEPAASAGAGFEPTAERFIDPGSGRAVQVFVDPRTGERRYVEG